MNSVKLIQKNLGFPEIEKIDPNTQEVRGRQQEHQTNTLGQAVIPGVVCAFFNYIIINKPNVSFLEQNGSDLLALIFGPKQQEMIDRVAQYGSVSSINAYQEMQFVAVETARLIRENTDGTESMFKFACDHKNEALLYLPASLKTGELVGNNNLDDRTNKMEGPISSLMHTIEKNFN